MEFWLDFIKFMIGAFTAYYTGMFLIACRGAWVNAPRRLKVAYYAIMMTIFWTAIMTTFSWNTLYLSAAR